jgi:uncharacterized protein YbjT (DUF2867 family)
VALVLVTGAAGDLGQHVVRHLLQAGHPTRRLLHRARPAVAGADDRPGDLMTGAGLEAAVDGVDAVIHCATNPFRPKGVDVEGTERLLFILRSAAPSAHVIYPSIVGIDRHPYYYYRAKVQAEERIAASGLPWTIQRATQFHELLIRALRPSDRLPFAVIPGRLRFQPMAASEAARRLVEIVAEGPGGRVPDIGGPAIREAVDLARAYRRSIGKAQRVISLPIAGKAAAAFKRGGHLLGEPRYGRQTWEEFLAQR